MLLSFLFPFADLRQFVDAKMLVKAPDWPAPQGQDDFVRFFGPVRRRMGGGLDTWVGENEVCVADRAVSFAKAPIFQDPATQTKLTLRCAYRRLFFEGDALGKFEIGIATKTRATFSLPSAAFTRLIQFLLGTQQVVRGISSATQNQAVALADLGQPIAKLYAAATWQKDAAATAQVAQQNWWVRASTPLVFVSHGPGELIERPSHAHKVMLPQASQLGFDLFSMNVRYSSGSVPLLLLSHGPSSSASKARTLRLYLTRLYAEHECLRFILDAIRTAKLSPHTDTPESQHLQRYLDEAQERVDELENKSAERFDPEIIEITRNSIGAVIPGARNVLKERMQALNLRRTVRRDSDHYVAKDNELAVRRAVREFLCSYPVEVANLNALCMSMGFDWENVGSNGQSKEQAVNNLLNTYVFKTGVDPLQISAILLTRFKADVRADLAAAVDAVLDIIQQAQ
jgi:hypothetical protein